jgi:hypothetical protein
VAYILITGPDQLHRLPAQGFGHRDGLSDVVGIATPTKASTQETIVDVDILQCHTSDFGGGRQDGFWILRTDPHIYTLRPDLCRAVHRLHASMGQIGHLVIGFHDFGSGFDRCQRILLLFGHHSRFIQCLPKGLPEGLGIGVGVASEIPRSGQHLERRLRPPEAIGHDGDAIALHEKFLIWR